MVHPSRKRDCKLISRLIRDFNGDVLTVPGRVIALIFVLALLVFPLLNHDPHILRILIMANIYVVFAVSWDLLSGYTGQMNLGHALFFGVAAYVAALLNIHYGLDPWLTIPIGGVAAAIAGLLVCLPALRLRGPYLALVTLALPFVAVAIVLLFKSTTNGDMGLYGIGRIFSSFEDPRDNMIVTYFFSLVMMLPSVLIMWKLTDARSSIVRLGIIFHAIREDEIAARACGINTVRYKFIAFAVGGFFAGIAGGFYAHFLRVVNPQDTLGVFLSFEVIMYTVFGGICSIYGAVAGVYFARAFVWDYLLTDVVEVDVGIKRMSLAIIMVLVLLFMPQGIAVWIRDKIEKTCPRCKLNNAFFRRNCRACGAELHVVKKKSITPDMSSG